MNRKVFTLIMFALLVFLLGARAATAQWISLPKASELGNSITSFFPVIFKNYPATSTIPPGVLYVFPSTATTDGDAGGRSAIQQICLDEDPDSHFCSIYEIENAWTTTGVLFSYPFESSWVDAQMILGTQTRDSNGAAKQSSWADISWNCAGWTGYSPSQGMVIENHASFIDLRDCSTTEISVSCCKRIP